MFSKMAISKVSILAYPEYCVLRLLLRRWFPDYSDRDRLHRPHLLPHHQTILPQEATQEDQQGSRFLEYWRP